tara:strand:- start:3623 stop:4024 length:402 start_codon:yes stop_codon:yes gene_type:complete
MKKLQKQFLAEIKTNKPKKKKLQATSKSHKVALAAFDEIDELLGHAEYLVLDAFTETMDKGDAAFMLGRDIMRFDFNDARMDAEARLDEVKETLDNLGIDYPAEVQSAAKRLSDLTTEENISRNRFDKWEAIY